MARLPVPEDLGQRAFQDRSSVVRPSVDFSGQQQLADTAMQVSSNINDRLDQASVRKAKIQFQKMKLEADNAFDADPDFESYQSRYDQMLAKAADESAKLVRGAALRDQFKEEIGLYSAEGSANIQKKAFAKEIDHGVADLNESLTLSRENYLRATTPADKAFARDSMIEAIDFAQQNNYIDADKAQALRQNAAVDLAIASVKVEPASKQVELLKANKGLIDVIPKDTRLKMIAEAEGQSNTEAALGHAVNIRSSGGTLSDRLAAADKIKDLKVRELTRQQVEVDFGREKRAEAQTQFDAYDTLKKEVIAGKSSVEVSKDNPDQWAAMTADQQQSIRSLDSRKTESSNLNVYNTLNQLAGENRDAAYQYFLENASKLSSADVKKWSDRFGKPEELDGYLTRAQRLDTALFGIGIKDKKTASYKLAQDQLDKDVLQFQKEKGRDPNAEELEKLITPITDKVVDTAWFNPLSRDKYGFNLTPTQRKQMGLSKKLDAFEVKLNAYEAALSARQGDVPVIITDEQKNDLYQAWDRDGLLDGE